MMRRLQSILAFVAVLLLTAQPLAAAERKPIVIGASGQQQQIQATDTLKTPAATTANASVNLPPGAAPSSPANGDAWTTSAGLYYRANGATFGPLAGCGAPLTLSGVNCVVASHALTFSYLQQVGGNSYLGNTTGSTGDITAYTLPDCHGSATAIQYTLNTGFGCGTITAVSGGSNPFAIGGANIKSGTGAPSVSSDPIGSIYLRTDLSQLWGQIVPSATVPTLVQSASGANTSSATFSATPASGDLLIASCSGYTSRPNAGTGWTDSGLFHNPAVFEPGDLWVYKFAVAGESTTQTPCSGGGAATGVVLFEVSGVPSWTGSLESNLFTTGQPLTYTTANANDLVLGAVYGQKPSADPGVATISGLSGGFTTAHHCCTGGGGGDGVGGAGQQFASSGSSVSVTYSFTTVQGQSARLVILKPATAGWRQFSWLNLIKSAGSSLETSPQSLNFSTGLTATTDGLGAVTITGNTGTVTNSGTLTSGRLLVGGGTTVVTTGLTDVTTDNVSSSNHGLAPKSPADATQFLNGATTPAYAAVKDSDLSTSDITTNNVSTSKHGFVPKAPNDATKCLVGDATWTTCPGGGLSAISADSVLANFTGSSVAPVGNALPSCSGSNDALTYNTTTHALGCHAPAGAGGGTVTSVATGAGLTGGTITGSGTLALSGATVPQGRLTLVSATPVLISDQTAKSTVYYDCYAGKLVPYYDGTTDQVEAISSCEVSLTMQTSGTGVTNTAGVFDVWWVHGGANRICVATNGSGGGWASDTGGSNTARGTGYSQVHNTRGYWTNVNSIASCYNGATNYGSVSADQATYLGSLYTTAAGQTGMAFQPTSAAGGTNNFLGLYNAYNRLRIWARNRNSDGSWSYGTQTWRAADNSSNGRISFVDGLQQSNVYGFRTVLEAAGPGNGGVIGMCLDSTSCTPAVTPESYRAGAGTGVNHSLTAVDQWMPQIGFHYVQAVEEANTGTATFYAGAVNATGNRERLSVELEM